MRGFKPGTVASRDIYIVYIGCLHFKSPDTDLFDPEDPGFGLKVQVAVLVELIPAVQNLVEGGGAPTAHVFHS